MWASFWWQLKRTWEVISRNRGEAAQDEPSDLVGAPELDYSGVLGALAHCWPVLSGGDTTSELCRICAPVERFERPLFCPSIGVVVALRVCWVLRWIMLSDMCLNFEYPDFEARVEQHVNRRQPEIAMQG